MKHTSSLRLIFASIFLSVVAGIVFTLVISVAKAELVDRPQFEAFLSECLKQPLCDPASGTRVGVPFEFGVTGYNHFEIDTFSAYRPDYVINNFLMDVLVWSLITLPIIVWLIKWRHKRRT